MNSFPQCNLQKVASKVFKKKNNISQNLLYGVFLIWLVILLVSVAEAFSTVCLKWGPPDVVRVDNGTDFANAIVESLLETFGVRIASSWTQALSGTVGLPD